MMTLIAQLRQSLGMLQVAFDAASEAMVIVDVDRGIHWAIKPLPIFCWWRADSANPG